MKKYASILMTSALISSLLLQPTVSAKENDSSVVETEAQQENFIKVIGKIESITEETKGNYFATVKSNNEEFGFYYNKSTVIMNNVGEIVELSEGVEITAFIDAKNPMLMIYPPRYSPDVVIVQTKKSGTVQLDQFNEQFLNKKEDLVIKVTEETIIQDLAGKAQAKADIVEKDILIFFDVVLESYPAQTSPSKILVLNKETSKIDKAITIANEDYYEVNSVKMIPLRRVAEQLGFQVDSTGRGAIVSKGNVSFTITRGTKQYGYNKALRYFQQEPELLEKGKTYVPYEMLEQLIELTETE
ncbi:stalk domain-containing protein [Lysinibacillus sp. SGAir0095]|uniref:stalk domain-containing protein n=1 Tax=Lysinibacillus sp. SGAir0095 TaxID=2070463 RepID=UPI0010CCCE59|nr:stalk domain-containing protein [Lysinibacillus sp. SGAir0095]QCR32221.1 copper amine oxidase [Lysinibacillus sp. SGAir0095]